MPSKNFETFSNCENEGKKMLNSFKNDTSIILLTVFAINF